MNNLYKQYKTFFDNAYDGFTVVDFSPSSRRHLNVNQQFCDMIGYTKEEVMARDAGFFVHPDSADSARAHMRGHREGTISHSIFKWKWITKEGKCIEVESKIYSKKTNKYNIGFGVHRDITRNSELETQIKEQLVKEANLRKIIEARSVERTNYIRLIVHELKTPITALMGSIELIDYNVKRGSKINLDNLYSSVSALNKRIDDLVYLTKTEMDLLRIRRSAIDTSTLIDQVVKEQMPIFRAKSQTFITDIEPNLPSIVADAEWVAAVLTNLLSNASKFSGKNTSVKMNIITNNNDLLFEVIDEGIGIKPSEIENIFDPYARVQRKVPSYSGLGLGLFLSKTFIELHGGNIWVESTFGKGSKFSFTLPKKMENLTTTEDRIEYTNH
ncbi:PAS domain-containing sensor histidine kinase [Dehalogenimonas etheniformans]|uniref:histidine kinase n=1 Tax=Dehalogenimonas etheniformans TaxID=1536648 RepID=A0A2P5P8Q3_9CHLR|nr:PAS domain-containing sensor histidine kinase [Dehalogenimonas etheniformans]PPD58670.1 PAS domain-containing sensor histidine kinase [Dehalogenimonas etheniformans]QNT76559.1 PAS domain S-box protein [Dehalogenimonas etheniformans]